MILLLYKGLTFGFLIAMIVGPIGILCIRNTLARGFWPGLATGLGAATADALFGCIAGFSMTFITQLLFDYQTYLQFFGGLFLCYLGVKAFLSSVNSSNVTSSTESLPVIYASTVLLTLTNPTTILSFISLFAGLGIGTANSDYLSALVFVLGVFLGSTAWWILLCNIVTLLRKKFSITMLRYTNKTSSIFITAFGLYSLVKALLIL